MLPNRVVGEIAIVTKPQPCEHAGWGLSAVCGESSLTVQSFCSVYLSLVNVSFPLTLWPPASNSTVPCSCVGLTTVSFTE